MRLSFHRLPIFAALLTAFLLSAIPDNARALDVQTCYQNQQNALINHAQAQSVAVEKLFASSTIPEFKTVYCWDSVLLPLKQLIGEITTAAAGGAGLFDAIGAAIWAAVMNVIQQIINSVCGVVANAVQSAISMVKSWMCLPIPSFNLSLSFGSFSQGTCNGVSLLDLAAGLATETRPVTPPDWTLWGYTRQ
jgi:hypothetical protein